MDLRSIQIRLAAFDLAPEPSPTSSPRISDLGLDGLYPDHRPFSDDDRAVRLRQVLDEHGPIFRAFRFYLSSRVDLLARADAAELTHVSVGDDPTPFAKIERCLRQAISRDPENLFADICEQSIHVDPLHQWHAAELATGESVVLKFVRPETESRFQRDLDLLDGLVGVALPGPSGKLIDQELLDAFRNHLRARADLGREAAALRLVARLAGQFESFVVPRLFEELCSHHLLTRERLDGSKTLSEPAADDDAAASLDAGRRVCMSWLQEALLGGRLVEAPLDSQLELLPDLSVALTGGWLRTIEDDSRRDLLDYLVAVAEHEPDRACRRLLRHTVASADALDPQRLVELFRQAEPFRDPAIVNDDPSRRIADTLFLHWRLADRSGRRPTPDLLALYRGLAALESLTRPLDDGRDSLSLAIDDTRVVGAAVQIRELIGPSQWQGHLERFLPAGREVLAQWERATELVRQGRFKIHIDGADGEDRSDSSGSFAMIVALIMALAAAALLTQRLVDASVAQDWSERLAALAFAAAAGGIVWWLNRHGATNR